MLQKIADLCSKPVFKQTKKNLKKVSKGSNRIVSNLSASGTKFNDFLVKECTKLQHSAT